MHHHAMNNFILHAGRKKDGLISTRLAHVEIGQFVFDPVKSKNTVCIMPHHVDQDDDDV